MTTDTKRQALEALEDAEHLATVFVELLAAGSPDVLTNATDGLFLVARNLRERIEAAREALR